LRSFALSEANAGSDAANQQTVATPRGDGFVLNGTKVWVANATRADVAIVFALTEPGARARGITAFLVPLDTPGILRRATDSLGVRGLGCMDLEFRDVGGTGERAAG
jgi:alkylation response protein AidB-like acyl-CoA dehydrogenase